MKIELLDDYNYTLYLNNLYIKDLNLDNKEDIENYLKKLFLIIKNRYDIDISGMFEIDIYVNNKYGIVIDIFKEDLEYLDYFSNQIDMQVNIIKDSIFLYELDSFIEKNLYKYNHKYYIDVEEIDNPIIYEQGNLVFGEYVIEVLKYGKKVNV